MATDDRYLDDVHYRGGCVTVSELSQYAVSQVAMNAMPPEAAFRGAAWRADWLARLEATPPWLFAWLRHQVDGPYWRQGSLAPDYDAIEAAIFNIGGWHDSYVDPAFRMQERCPAPSHTLVGPWHHSWPHDAEPGPNLDELHEIARFFDRHLRGIDNGWDDEPPVVWFERDHAPPTAFPSELPGRWRAATAYPHPSTTLRSLAFGARQPGRDAGRAASIRSSTARRPAPAARCRGAPAVRRTASPATCAAMRTPARPTRRRPWTTPVEVLGVPEVVVHLAVDVPIATLAVRLSDVAPDGSVALVSAGVLNLTHRHSHAEPEPLEPGVVEAIRVPLRTAGYRWAAGHRIRIALASQQWPVLWPSPLPATFSVRRGAATPSRLELPVIPAGGWSRRRTRARVPHDATGADLAGSRGRRRPWPGRRGRAGVAHRRGRHRRIDDGPCPRRRRGHRPGRPPPVRRRDPADDRLGRRPCPSRARRPTSSIAGRSASPTAPTAS